MAARINMETARNLFGQFSEQSSMSPGVSEERPEHGSGIRGKALLHSISNKGWVGGFIISSGLDVRGVVNGGSSQEPLSRMWSWKRTLFCTDAGVETVWMMRSFRN